MQTENPISAEIVFTSLNLGMQYYTQTSIYTSGWTRSQLDLKGPWTRLDLSYRKKITEHDFGYQRPHHVQQRPKKGCKLFEKSKIVQTTDLKLFFESFDFNSNLINIRINQYDLQKPEIQTRTKLIVDLAVVSLLISQNLPKILQHFPV